ncbi:hypothetical protein O6H91_09G013300 [Diphasiastrum complanatum]|uniref:Uncharacterized protein n=1 Tax=Diphasiastrum complanatum TaxID=34168 RepID=A0ACC2CLH8_DIPCM|nr:hypothetical protein O6H91_09G013300 [Diphasiastrum complanatum]
MGLLDKLWDDVLAGPQPDKGLGRLRKDKLSLDVDASGFDEDRRLMYERRRSGEFQYSQDEARRVTQSIDILKPPVLRSFGPDESLPSTPSGTSAPLSPSLASPRTRGKTQRMSRSSPRHQRQHDELRCRRLLTLTSCTMQTSLTMTATTHDLL